MRSDLPVVRTFIVRIRLEPGAGQAGRGEWRGELERVPDGARRFFRGVDGITAAMEALLEENGS